MQSMFESLSTFPLTLITSFSLIGLAEIGDKSQLVCMTLAARYRAWPVFFAAALAFALLNILAVVFGAAAAHWIPENVVTLIVGVLFLLFGIHAYRNSSADGDSDNSGTQSEIGAHSLFVSTFLLITLAEFGDKTQIAVAGLSSTSNPYAVWLGATLALVLVSALGVWLGRSLVRRISIKRLHQISGVLFIVLGVLALLSIINLTHL